MFPSLATPGNITRNIVSATMFPSLARLLVNMKDGMRKNNRAAHAARTLVKFLDVVCQMTT